MADPNSKKFIIIPEGTTLFPETGKKRVRVFEDEKKAAKEKQAREDRIELLKREQEENKKLASSLGILQEAMGVSEGRIASLNRLNKKRLALIEKKNKLIALGLDLSGKEEKRLERLTNLTEVFADGQKKVAKALDEKARATQAAALEEEKLSAVGKAATAVIGGMSSALSAANMSAADFSGGIGSMASKIADMGKKFNESSISIQKNTGLGKQASDQMREQVAAGRDLGVTNDMMNKTTAGLNNEMSNFHRLTKEQQDATIGLSNTMSQLGVDAATTGRSMDILQQGMGLSRAEAQAAVEDFSQLATGLGLPTATLIEGFKELGPQLSRFGKDGKQEFEKLAKQSRALGISTKAAFDIGEAFDTFEGAADMAGKLNAQLGLQINSVEMLKGTHSERIQMLQEEFRSSGKSFDSMHRRQQQAVAEMMGVDVDVARKMFGDPAAYKQYQKDQEEAKARAERLTTIQEKLASVADRLLNAFGPLGEALMSFVLVLSNPVIAGAIIIFTTLAGVWKTVQLAATAAGIAAKAWWGITHLGNVITSAGTTLTNAYNMALYGKIEAKEIAIVQEKRGIVVDNAARQGIIATTVQTLRNTGARIANTVKGIVPGTKALFTNSAATVSNKMGVVGSTWAFVKNTAARAFNATKGIVLGTYALIANSAAWLWNKGLIVASTAMEWLSVAAKAALAAVTWLFTGALGAQSGAQATVGLTAPIAAAGTKVLGKAAGGAHPKLLLVAAAIGLMGAGMGVMWWGMSKMLDKLRELVLGVLEFAKSLDPEMMFKMALGIAAVSASLGLMAVAFAGIILTAAPAGVSLGVFALAAWFAKGDIADLGSALKLVGLGTEMAAKGFASMKAGLEAIDRTIIQGIADDLSSVAKHAFSAAMALPLMALGVAALGAVAFIAVTPIQALGFALMFIGMGILMATSGLERLVKSFSDLAGAQDGLDAMSKVIEVSTNMDSSALKNLDEVSKKIIQVSTQISAGSSENLEAMAKVLGGAQGGGGGDAGGGQQIILKIDGTKIAEVLSPHITKLQNTNKEDSFRYT